MRAEELCACPKKPLSFSIEGLEMDPWNWIPESDRSLTKRNKSKSQENKTKNKVCQQSIYSMDTCVSTKRSEKVKKFIVKINLGYILHTLHFAHSWLLVLSFTLI